jgi:hypothetical protein
MLKPLTQKRLHAALRRMGRDGLKPLYRDAWTPDMPTRGYCWVVTELVYKLVLPELKKDHGYQLRRMDTGGGWEHWFLYNPDTDTVIDCTSDQFIYSWGHLPDYTRGKPGRMWPALSLRCRQLADLLGIEWKEK